MRSSILAVAVLLGSFASAQAKVLINVDQSSQNMQVIIDDVPTYDWRVSTGKPGYDTPNGNYRPNRLDADHHSDEYDGAPMPFAIFFDLNGHAIHGTYEKIGKPGASHGCVRLTPQNARTLFQLVQKAGLSNVAVHIDGDVKLAMLGQKTPAGSAKAAQRTRSVQQARPVNHNWAITNAEQDGQLYERPLPRRGYGDDLSQWRSAPDVYPGALY